MFVWDFDQCVGIVSSFDLSFLFGDIKENNSLRTALQQLHPVISSSQVFVVEFLCGSFLLIPPKSDDS